MVGLNIIKKYEGLYLKPYLCPAGYPTIGYGHVIRPTEKVLFYNGITKEKSDVLLREDVVWAARAVNNLIWSIINQGQFDALVSFTFNLGSGALQSSTLRRVINRGEYWDAPYQLRRWVYAGGRKLNGLIRRRNEEAILFSFSTH